MEPFCLFQMGSVINHAAINNDNHRVRDALLYDGDGGLHHESRRAQEMNKCDRDNTPCLHVACLQAEGIKCCAECVVKDKCASVCFKAVDK